MRYKQFTALLLSAIVAFSSCMPVSLHAFAAEGSAVEDDGGQLPEESRESEDTVEEEDDSDSNAGADAAVDEDVEVPDEESENAADAAADDGEAAQADGSENAAADVTADENEAAPEDAAADVTADENEIAPEEEPENAQTDSAETDGKGIEAEKTKADAGTETKEQEDVYLPIIVEGGAVEGTRKNSFMASSAWDAEKLASLPILETDVSSASDGCILLGLPGEYIADQQAVLDRINEIRREACEEGVTNPETGRPLTMADYVPLKWSYELEEISRIRAAEVSMTADHERTNGDNWQSMDSEYWYVGECAAWNYGRSATSGIEQWYNEKDYWLEGNSNKSGHYTTLIRPAMRHVGGATFYSRFTQYPNTTLIEFYTEEGVDESFVDMTGECIQKLEVSEANLNGNPSIIGTLSGIKNDEQPLYLVTNAKYSGMFTAYAHNLVFLDDVSWNSSNSGIAAVTSDGIVKAGKCGSSTITAQAENGSSAEAEFTVDHVLQKIPAVDPTCTATGLTEGEKCANCGTVTIKQETIAAKGHSYGSWTVTKKATCTAAGSRKKTCTVCGNVVTEKIPATGHKWETEYTVDTAATCTVDGSESIHCSVCDAINSSTVRAIPKTAHTYGKWTVTKQPTCTEKGSKVRTCKVCGKKETKSIPVLTPGWKQDANGWKYLRPDTTYPKSQFEVIEENTYYFNDLEYRVTGLQEIEGAKYYFNEDGVMQTGWQTIDGEKYYFDENGAAHIGWLKSGDDWYYFRLTGVMHTGSLKKDGIYYYFRKDGTRLSGWLQVGGKIFYYKLNGERLTGWLQKNGKKFYFKTNGEMHTGWLKLNGKYYYFKENGQMVTGRYKIGNKWFTFNSNGVRQ